MGWTNGSNNSATTKLDWHPVTPNYNKLEASKYYANQ